MDVYGFEEADDVGHTKPESLARLAEQIRRNETPAVVDMYERAAWRAGASVAETEMVMSLARGGMW